MRILISTFVIVLAAALEGAALAEGADGCPDGYYKVGEKTEETADAIIVHPVCKRMRTKAGIYAGEFCKAKSYVDADIRAAKALDFDADIVQFGTYEELSREQRNVFIYKAMMAEVDQALEAGKMAAEAAKPLNPWSVNNAIKDLQKRGYKNEKLFAAVRQISKVKNKPERAAAYKEFVRQATAFRTGAETGYGAGEEPDTAGLQLVLGLLKIVEVSPEAALVVTTADFAESAGWYISLNTSVNQQMEVTDRKLVQLGKIRESLKTNVARLKAARAKWAQASGKSGDPVCDLDTGAMEIMQESGKK